MKRQIYGLILALACVTSPGILANEFTVVTSVAYQNKELTFNQKYSGNDSNRAKFSVDLPMVNASVTTAYKKFFATVKLETNISDTPSSTSETNRSLVGQANLIALPGSEVNVGREDFTITLGYNVWDSLNIFVGYLKGETELTPDPFCANPFDTAQCSRTNRAFFQFFLKDNGFVQNQSEYKQKYQEKGPYVGASYTFRFESVGNLTLSLAYADMDGEYRDNANDPNNEFADPFSGAPTFVAFNYKGDTTGTSLGATWSGSLGDATAYFIDLRRQEYSMTGKDVTNLANFAGISLRTDEEMLGLTVGVQFYF